MAVRTPTRPTPKAAAPRWLDDPDVGLMVRVQEGDDEAFEELLSRYRPRIFGYFCRQIGDRSEAEDLTQEVFLRLYRAKTTYRPRARFGTWVFHITQNVARNAFRSRKRHPWLRRPPATEEGGLLDQLPADRGECPADPVERAERAGVVRAAVAGLANRQRTALELHQFHDHTYAEVAEELDMTPKAAKSLLYRARNQLRESLAGFMG